MVQLYRRQAGRRPAVVRRAAFSRAAAPAAWRARHAPAARRARVVAVVLTRTRMRERSAVPVPSAAALLLHALRTRQSLAQLRASLAVRAVPLSPLRVR